jgi:nucleotide-binding universal stress UspA family protein
MLVECLGVILITAERLVSRYVVPGNRSAWRCAITGQASASAKPAIAAAPADFRNIVFPTDFSLCSAAALPYVSAIAERYGATVHILHVEEFGLRIYPVDDPYPLIEEPDASAQEKMGELLQSRWFNKISFTQTIAKRDIWGSISDLVADTRADLVIVATHGRSGFQHFVLGSVAEKILRHAPCPVLTVGPEARKRGLANGRMDAVLYATDLSSTSVPALDYAIALARKYYSELILLHASQDKATDFCDQPDLLGGMRRRLKNLMKDRPAVEYDVVVEWGFPAELIIALAAERKADLIVMGVHSAVPILEQAPGAVAYEAVCRAPCPVLTVRS